MVNGAELPSWLKTLSCTSAAGNTAILKTAPCCANHVSVHPPLSQIRVGALLLIRRTAFRESAMWRGLASSASSTVGHVNFVRNPDAIGIRVITMPRIAEATVVGEREERVMRVSREHGNVFI